MSFFFSGANCGEDGVFGLVFNVRESRKDVSLTREKPVSHSLFRCDTGFFSARNITWSSLIR